VKLKHTNSIFEVMVDDKVCFSTDHVALPAGNTFGITAATPETPDSFEVFKFVLQSAAGQGIPAQQMNSQQQQQQQILNQNSGNAAAQQAQANLAADPGMASGFADLSGRLQLTNKATQNILQDLRTQSQKSDSRHAELQQTLVTKGELAAMDARLQRIEAAIQYLQRDLPGKDIRESFNQLEKTLRSSHLSLSENLQGHVFNGKTQPHTNSLIVFSGWMLTAFSYDSHHRLHSAHGLLHLPGVGLPAPPGRLLCHL
jgi:mannose-binding lectin 1